MIVALCDSACKLKMQQLPSLVYAQCPHAWRNKNPPPNLKHTRGAVTHAVPVTAYFSKELR